MIFSTASLFSELLLSQRKRKKKTKESGEKRREGSEYTTDKEENSKDIEKRGDMVVDILVKMKKIISKVAKKG